MLSIYFESNNVCIHLLFIIHLVLFNCIFGYMVVLAMS